MKTTYKYLIPALLFLLPACEREMPGLDEPVPGEPVMVSVSMEPETRATLADDSGDLAFSAGDAIKIFDGTAVYTGVTSSTTSDAIFAMPSGFSRTGTGYAGFPASLVSTITSGGVTFVLPDTYELAQVGGMDGDASVVSSPMIGTYSGGGAVSLKQAGSVVRFFVTNVAAGSLVFTFPTEVTGTVTITTPGGSDEGILATSLSGAGNTITVTGVPQTPEARYVCVTLPVPVGTVPGPVRITNVPDGTSQARATSIDGSVAPLQRACGNRLFASLTEVPLPKISVSDNVAVVFSPGNLQYQASTATLRFAEHQYDFVGSRHPGHYPGNVFVGDTKCNNEMLSSTYDGWIDLMGFGTSGFFDMYPYVYPVTGEEPFGPDISSGEWTFCSAEWDWGRHNEIVNGSSIDPAGTWRTLTGAEWDYLLNTRAVTNSLSPGARYTMGTLGERFTGMIIFPDHYIHPDGTDFSAETFNAWSNYTSSVSLAGWEKMEEAGCVFLPASGYRQGRVSVYETGEQGGYWSSTISDSRTLGLRFAERGGVIVSSSPRDYGLAVRLVRVVETTALPLNVTLSSSSLDLWTPSALQPTLQLSVTVKDAMGNSVPDAVVTWSKLNGSSAVVNAGGCVTATTDAGVSTVRASVTYGGIQFYSDCTVTVEPTVLSYVNMLPSAFTVNSSGGKVLFSSGNLQYIGSASTPYWKFADHQIDFLGDSTGQVGSNPDIDRDLFGVGTGNEPCKVINDAFSYDTFIDWGINPIKNGTSTDAANTWRTLSGDEWTYLLASRTVTNTLSPGARFTYATLGCVYRGMILFPDNYVHPSDAPIGGSPVFNTNSNFTAEVSPKVWEKMEAAGCVFLPAAGYRYNHIYAVGSEGQYWSSTHNTYTANGHYSRGIYINANRDASEPGSIYNTMGCSVRLAKDL